MGEIKKCPHCGNEEEYYSKDYVKGSTKTNYRFDGKETENGDMYQHLSHNNGKYAYCSSCHKRLFEIEYQEARVWVPHMKEVVKVIIRDERLSATIDFTDLEVGETFEHSGYIYVKFSGSTMDVNSLEISEMYKETFELGDKVVRIPSELVLHEPGWDGTNK